MMNSKQFLSLAAVVTGAEAIKISSAKDQMTKQLEAQGCVSASSLLCSHDQSSGDPGSTKVFEPMALERMALLLEKYPDLRPKVSLNEGEDKVVAANASIENNVATIPAGNNTIQDMYFTPTSAWLEVQYGSIGGEDMKGRRVVAIEYNGFKYEQPFKLESSTCGFGCVEEQYENLNVDDDHKIKFFNNGSNTKPSLHMEDIEDTIIGQSGLPHEMKLHLAPK